jgi:hypothetical protein
MQQTCRIVLKKKVFLKKNDVILKKNKRKERCQNSIILKKIKIVLYMVGLKKVVYGFWPDFEHLFLSLVSLKKSNQMSFSSSIYLLHVQPKQYMF